VSRLTTRKPEIKTKRKIDNSLHAELCKQGKKWLEKTIGARLAISELRCLSKWGEIPDVIGWKSGYSLLIEAKTSRSDFKADSKKKFRINQEYGMGNYRLYLCPEGLIKPEELPENWGLLYYSPREKNLKRVVCFKGNILNNSGNLKRQKSFIEGEKDLLLSYACRMKE
jgi:hypothetical protein